MTRLAYMAAICAFGCVSPRSEPAASSFNSDSSSQSSDVAAAVERLIATPAEQSLAIPSVVDGSTRAIHIPTYEDLASDGRRLTLHVDSVSDVAWIEVSGGIADHIHESFGPWSASHRDVQLLIEKLTAR